MTIPILMAGRHPTINWGFLGAIPSTMTFSRAGNATYFDSTGTLQTAATNIPRFEYDPVTLEPIGLLLEGQRTNLLVGSETFTGTGWSGTNSTLTPGQAGSPDGLNKFNLFQRNSTAASYRQYNTYKAASSLPFSLFFDVKKGSGKYFAIRLQGAYPNRTDAQYNLDTGVAVTATNAGTGFAGVASMRYIGNGVYRCFLSSPTTDAHTLVSVLFSFNDNSTQISGTNTTGNTTGYVTDGQLEQSTFSSSYIPTTSAAATRAADSLYTTNIPWFKPNEGTIVSTFDWIGGEVSSFIHAFSDATINNQISSYSQTNGQNYGSISIGGSGFSSTASPTSLVSRASSKIGLVYKAGQNKAAFNGVLNGDGTLLASNLPSGMSKLNLGNRTDGLRPLFGHIRSFKYWNRAISDAEMKRITT